MRKIYFVTTNPGKVASAKKYIDQFELEQVEVELIEPRSDNVEEISKIKAIQAYEKIGAPVIVLDAGFFINSLNGFPKAFVNHTLDTIGISGIIKLLEGVNDRSCYFLECLTYYDGLNFEFFFARNSGTISLAIQGSDRSVQWSPLWRIFIPDNCSKTMSEMTPDERHTRTDDYVSPFKQLNEWIGKEQIRTIK